MMAEKINDDDGKSLLSQQVSFVQHYLPGLDAGGYQLQIQQEILDSSGKHISGRSYNSNYNFVVAAQRFTISQPGNTIFSVFPADNATGEFGNVLPHVVFSQETFPWVRYPTTAMPYALPAPGTDTDADVPTWLWVMLLDEDDVQACQESRLALKLKPSASKIADLFPPAALPDKYTSTLADNYSYFHNATNANGLEPGENLDDVIQTIDVPLELFWKIAPTIADLKQMAHGRVVSLINQPTVTNTSDPGEPNGSFSIVFGNRLPSNEKKTAAFLVSLEELQAFLPDLSTGGAPSGNAFDGKRNIRLAVLRSWNFFTSGQPASFVDQLLRLNGRVVDPANNQGPDAANTNLTLAYSGPSELLRAAFNMGYVALNQTLRTSGKTVSWYRGPLTPYAVARNRIKPPLLSPDAATILDPTTGMLDTSYAAAWTLGRMLALQDSNFSSAYYNWKRGVHQQLLSTVENHKLEQSFGVSLNLASPAGQAPANTALKAPWGATSLLRRTIMSLNPEE